MITLLLQVPQITILAVSLRKPPTQDCIIAIEHEDLWLNEFANRCFRDVADQDYIAARLSFRHGLFPQFLWQAQQAIEKYLKAILLYNRVPARKVGHDLHEALSLTEKLPFEIDLTQPCRNFIDYLAEYGGNRYFQTPYHLYGPKMTELDRAVWQIRRYCIIRSNQAPTQEDAGSNPMSAQESAIRKIQASRQEPPHHFRGPGGLLERILDNPNHLSRGPLIWNNPFFSTKARRQISVPTSFTLANPPLAMNPGFLDSLLKYVYISREDKKGYRELLKKRRMNG